MNLVVHKLMMSHALSVPSYPPIPPRAVLVTFERGTAGARSAPNDSRAAKGDQQIATTLSGILRGGLYSQFRCSAERRIPGLLFLNAIE